MRLPDSLRVLRRREFRLLFFGQTVSLIGDRMIDIALAFAVLEIGGSPTEVGLVLAAHMLPLVACLLIGGVVADRSSRRGVMVVADLVRIASQGALAVLLISGNAEIWMLAALAGVSGAGAGFFMPAATGLLPELVPPEDLQPANALRATASSAGEIAGPLVAGVIVAVSGPGWAFALDAATFAVSAVFLVMMRVPARARGEPSTFLRDLLDGWDAFRSRTWVWTFVTYFAVANIFWGGWTALGPVVADRDLGGAAAWGFVMSAFGVGALVGSVLALRAHPSKPLVVVALTEGLFALPLAFLAAAHSTALLAVGAFLAGGGMMLGMSVWESTLQRHIPEGSLSRVSSYDWFGSLAFVPLGLAIWPPIAVAVGISTALWIGFALFLACVAVLLCVPDIRRLPAYPPGE